MSQFNLTGWSLLRDGSDWTTYQRLFVENEAKENIPLAFGNGPVSYPALVSAVQVELEAGPLVLCAFIYPEDAQRLIEAAAPAPSVKPLGPSQDNFNRYATANLLSLVQALVDAKLLSPAAYEEAVLGNLATVDQWQAADAVRRAGFAQKDLLDKLYPSSGA